jgi:hypothetical protein
MGSMRGGSANNTLYWPSERIVKPKTLRFTMGRSTSNEQWRKRSISRKYQHDNEILQPLAEIISDPVGWLALSDQPQLYAGC